MSEQNTHCSLIEMVYPLTQRPTVSVVVPCFNCENELDLTIDSLLAQTFPPIEIIVVDDGSTDGSSVAAAKWGYPVKLVKQANAGAAVARYTGVCAAEGDIIVFNDAGDVSRHDRLAVLCEALLKHRDCVAATGLTHGLETTANSVASGNSGHPEGDYEVIKDPVTKCLGQYWPLSTAMNMAVWRTTALQYGKVDSFFLAANDYALQAQIASAGSFVAVHKILMTYKPTRGGLSARHGLYKQRAYALIAAQHLMDRSSNTLSRVATFRHRVTEEWIDLCLRMYLQGDHVLARNVARIGLTQGHARHIPSRLWWALNRAEDEGTLSKHRLLNQFVRYFRKLR